MKKTTLADLKRLVGQATSITSSGHPFLDERWLSDAEPRNAHYRRQYYRFCQLLTKELKPGLVVELGIDEGDCCGHFASGNPETQVIGIDIHKDDERPSQRCRKVEQLFPNFKYVRDWTWSGIKQVKAPIDVLFIDSWHEEDYFARDWNDYSKLLRPGSVVLIDDLNTIPLGWDALPYEKHAEDRLNHGPIGMFVYDGKSFELPCKPMLYMPEFKNQ